ncbi:hypothetical protein [Sedimentitalea sp.]|uniref:hypothetical protein n=1 Tax=Sedimentitalea sp. TaxID=2048915 RepID=UPI0032975D7E
MLTQGGIYVEFSGLFVAPIFEPGSVELPPARCDIRNIVKYVTFLKRAVDVTEHLCSIEKSDLILMQLISVSNSDAAIAALTGLSRKDANLPCSLAGHRGIKQKINGDEGGHMRIETALLALKAD